MASGRSLKNKLSQRKDSLLVKLEFLPLVGRARKWIRGVRGGAKRLKTGRSVSKQDSALGFKLPQFGRFRLNIRPRVIYIIFFGVLFLVLAAVGYKYSMLVPHTSELSNNEIKPIWGSTLTTLFIGYEEKDGYKYIDFMAIMQLTRNSDSKHKLLIIDPEIATNSFSRQFLKYRNAFNNAELLEKQPVDLLRKSVEDLAGIPVDRYVLVQTDNLTRFLDAFSIQYIATDNVNDPDAGIVKPGDLLSGNELTKYLAAEKQGIDARAARIAKFGQYAMGRIAGIGTLQLFWHSELLLSLLETNMSREELIAMAWTLIQRSEVQIGYLRSSELYYVRDRDNGFYAPDVVRTAERMQDIFSRSEVQREQGRVEIYNATNTPGLASKVRRFLDTQGANVVRTGNATELTLKTKLYVPDIEKYTANTLLIRELLRGDVIIVDEEFPLNHTAELVLVLGDDVADI